MNSTYMQQDCSRAVKSLSSLSNDELDKIMNDDEQIELILAGMDQSFLKEIQAEKDTLLASNGSLAEENLLREPELAEGRDKLHKCNQELDELHKIIEQKAKELRQKGGDLSLETTLALLRTAASEMEEESDVIAKKFLGNEHELDEFLEQFLNRRKLMHLRLVKAEKLAKIISRDANIGNYVNAPPVNINAGYFPGIPANPGGVPYPAAPIGMPMPGNFFQNHY